MDLSAYLYIRTNVCDCSCLLFDAKLLIAVVCMSDSLRASAQIYTVTTSSVPWPKKRKICNLEAYDKYIKKFKSDWEAAGIFLSDEGLLSEKAEVFFFFFHKNESQGLGTLSEEPLEQSLYLARKTTQQANVSDVLTRLWVKSDPIVRSYRSIVKCSFCNGQHNVRSCPHRQAAISEVTGR